MIIHQEDLFMDHEHRMSRLEEMREEQLKREHGHPDGKGHLHSQHHSLHGMLGNRPEAGHMGEEHE